MADPHVHRLPGGRVHDEHCTCLDPTRWPPRFVEPITIEEVRRLQDGPFAMTSGTVEFGEPALEFEELRRRAPSAALGVALGRLRAAFWAEAERRLLPVLAALAWALKAASRTARLLWRGAGRAVALLLVVLWVRLEYVAVIAGVGVGTWAAWEVDATAGKVALAGGLLFLGGGIGRLRQEIWPPATR